MYSTLLTHVALKKLSGHKSRHIFKFHILHTRHRTKKTLPIFVSPAKQKRDICIAFSAAASSASSSAAA